MEKYIHGLNLAHTTAICKTYFNNQDAHRTELLDYATQAFIATLLSNAQKRTANNKITKNDIITELELMQELSLLTQLKKEYIIEDSPPKSLSKRTKIQ
jgi:hypothetical protein